MSDSRPTTYAALAKRPSDYSEVELLPAAANPLNTIATAEMFYRRYALATPVSGSRTARMHLRQFQRTAQLMMEAVDDINVKLADAFGDVEQVAADAAALYSREFGTNA